MASAEVFSALLNFGRSYGKQLSFVAITTFPLKPSCRRVSAHAMEAAPFAIKDRKKLLSIN